MTTFTGGVAAVIPLVYSFRVQAGIADMRERMAAEDLGMFQGIGEAMAASIQIEYGFVVMLAGSIA
ncbi:MAG TPA: hypothetical protein VK837_00045 [Longimicrobiales bacterium]|nr:hypothetical protein [Longimicrobiales bacterium]